MESLYTRVSTRTEEEMEKEHITSAQVRNMKGSSEMGKEKEKEPSTGMIPVDGRELLLIMKWTEKERSMMEKTVGVQSMKRDS